MDWHLAIARNRDALCRFVAALAVMAGLAEIALAGSGPKTATLPRHLRNHLYRILRPAESAVCRLIVMAARDLAVTYLPPCGGESDFDGLAEPSAKAKRQKSQERGVRGGRQSRPIDNDLSIGAPNPKVPSLPLFDPLKRFDAGRKTSKSFPRISFIGITEPCPVPAPPSPGDPVGAERVCERLTALNRALGDLDRQARRLARWRARRSIETSSSSGLTRGPKRSSPMRPGRPPGYRKRPEPLIGDLLNECHALAWEAWNTS